MTTGSHTEWRLYVDESGDFGEPEGSVAVAGLLVSEEFVRGPARTLRSELERDVPGLPWPWHATWLNVPLWVALNIVITAERGRRHAQRFRPAVLEAAHRSLEVVRRHHRFDLQRIERMVRSEEEPSAHRATLAAWKQLVTDEGEKCLAVVEDYALEAKSVLQRALEKLARTAEEAGQPDSTMLVLAGELQDGDALEPETAHQPHGDRYLNLLRVLLQRAGGLVSSLPGSHTIVPFVLGRAVFYRDIKGTGFLSAPALNAVATSLRPSLPPNIAFGLGTVHRYKGDLAVEFVIADFLANRLRPALDRKSKPLALVENDCRERCGVRPRLRTPSRSALTASGDAFTLVNEGIARGRRVQDALPVRPGRRRWACEQAWEWTEAR